MSVAFRRESDEEHLEPKFEIPVPAGPNLVTPRGMAQIEGKVAAYEAEVALGAASDQTKREMRYWRARLATARIAPPPLIGEAGFGSRVIIRFDGTERRIDIVGDDEADPALDRLAFTAPLARVLIGSGEGDLLDFGGRTEAVEIVSVEVIPG